jgi:hypothetical protein
MLIENTKFSIISFYLFRLAGEVPEVAVAAVVDVRFGTVLVVDEGGGAFGLGAGIEG